MKIYRKSILQILLAAALCGCTVGPDYESAHKTVGEREVLDFANFKNDSGMWRNANPRDNLPRGNWWELFGDEKLSAYMLECERANPDLKSLFYKVEQARENAMMKEGALYPHAVGSGDWFKTEVGDRSLLRPLGTQFEDWAVGATLTWDADLFGRIRSMLAASRADAQALQSQYENVLLSLRTQVATLYFALREMQSMREVLEKTVAVRQSETKFVRDRFEMQTATEADVQRAVEQEFSAKTQLTDIIEKSALAKNMMANLLGTVPAKIEISPAPLGGNVPEIPAVIPSELLERRADIAAAERAVCAANARIGAAQAAFFPTVSITSSLGTESTAFSKLLNSSSFAWGVSPQVYIPIFQAGRLSAQKRVALAKHKEALENYKSAVLKAVRETEDALAKISLSKRRTAERLRAADAARRVDEIAQTQYEGGVADYFQASQAHRYALLAQLALIKSRGEEFRAAVELIRAVGGCPPQEKRSDETPSTMPSRVPSLL